MEDKKPEKKKKGKEKKRKREQVYNKLQVKKKKNRRGKTQSHLLGSKSLEQLVNREHKLV